MKLSTYQKNLLPNTGTFRSIINQILGNGSFSSEITKKASEKSALKKDQKVEILTTLIRKLELLIFGFNKHGKRAEAIRFQKEKSQFSQLLQDFPKPTPFIR